eukprot:TRINITY_DN12964_c0_g1_i1.p1 TRINITY_DN12964_c0_g1~~TRINITY_DN12964_c0_g1_i1.p1  ORF type:complete len:99 (+),score=13.16 TRINITY_DN12964_c0_g1_i1:592-888(+)
MHNFVKFKFCEFHDFGFSLTKSLWFFNLFRTKHFFKFCALCPSILQENVPRAQCHIYVTFKKCTQAQHHLTQCTFFPKNAKNSETDGRSSETAKAHRG